MDISGEMNMKKLIALLLCVLMVLSVFAGCASPVSYTHLAAAFGAALPGADAGAEDDVSKSGSTHLDQAA